MPQPDAGAVVVRNVFLLALLLGLAALARFAPPAAPQAVVAEAAPLAPTTTREQWAIDLLAAMGNERPSAQIVAFVVAWTIAEDDSDGALSRNNPLNTTQCGHHQVSAINGDGACGVAGYATYQDGIDATVDTLLQANFSAIAAALAVNDAQGARAALFAAPWAESHYGYGASWPQGETQ